MSVRVSREHRVAKCIHLQRQTATTSAPNELQPGLREQIAALASGSHGVYGETIIPVCYVHKIRRRRQPLTHPRVCANKSQVCVQTVSGVSGRKWTNTEQSPDPKKIDCGAQSRQGEL